MHTTYSDGLNTPEELAKLAHEGGLNVISVTDHDRVDSVDAVRNACAQYGITAIPGVEISTTYEGKALHVLGYNMDVTNEDFLGLIKKINGFRKEKFLEKFPLLNEALREAGKPEANIEHYKDKDPRYYSHPGLALFLAEEGITANKQEGFQYLKNMKGTTPHVEPEHAFAAIKKAGGVAVLSHPFAPKISLAEVTSDRAEQEKFIAKFTEQGMDGLECYQAGHTDEDVEFCKAMAEKYNLLITAGSDWHGYHSPEDTGIRAYLPFYINALGDLKVPEEDAKKIARSLGAL